MSELIFPNNPNHLDTYTDPNQAIWQYDSDGPYWNVITSTTRKNFSGTKLKLSAGYDLTASYTIITFDTPEFNIDQYYRNVEGRLFASTTGYYRVNITLFTGTQGNGTSYAVQVRKNGSEILSTGFAGPNQAIAFDETLSLIAGDYIELLAKESTATGSFLDTSSFTMYRIGFSPGTGISNHNAFSGVRATLTDNFACTSTETAISFSGTEFNINANVVGGLYWASSVPDQISPATDGYFRLRSFVQTNSSGSNNSYTIKVDKTNILNVTTVITSTTLGPNDFADLDEVVFLETGDQIKLKVSNSGNIGQILNTSYLELIREGV